MPEPLGNLVNTSCFVDVNHAGNVVTCLKNTSLPVSTLSKKHNAINYHDIHEATAMGIIKVGKEDLKSNLANFLTKILGGEAQ